METGNTSVFTDDSGARKRTVSWLIRGLSCTLGLGVATVGLSMIGHVTLPGLDAPLQLPGSTHAKKLAPTVASGAGANSSASGSSARARTPLTKTPADAFGSRRAVEPGPTPSTATPSPAASTPSTPVATPTPPAASPSAGPATPTAKSTHAASPAHTPGSGTEVPPGQAKKASNTP